MTTSNSLSWIDEAMKYVGLKEIPGKSHNPTIINWLVALGAWWKEDETPWCGTFVAHVLRQTGRHVPKHWYRAKAWLDAGTSLNGPAYGCLAIFDRKGGGHVGFVVGKDKMGNLMILGGNQNNEVSIRPFSQTRLVGYVWPSTGDGKRSWPTLQRYNLPVLSSKLSVSTNEA